MGDGGANPGMDADPIGDAMVGDGMVGNALNKTPLREGCPMMKVLIQDNQYLFLIKKVAKRHRRKDALVFLEVASPFFF